MNTYMQAKIEACLELSFGSTSAKKAEKFKTWTMQVTGLSEEGFHNLGMTDVAYNLIKEGKHTNQEILDIAF